MTAEGGPAALRTETPLDRARTALSLLAIDPAGLKGLWIRARAGPPRDLVTGALGHLPLPGRRLHPGIGDDALFGGLDLAATLATGAPVTTAGLLARPSCLVLTMAERCPPGLAARLAHALDAAGHCAGHCLVALDEGAAGDEVLPGALADRIGLFLDLSDLSWSDGPLELPDLAAARARLHKVRLPPDLAAALVRAAAALGIGSLRAPALAAAAARAAAAFAGRGTVSDEDARLAATLVFAHRAAPMAETDTAPPPPPDDSPETPPDDAPAPAEGASLPEELLVEAARAALPADLLAALAAGRAGRAARGAAGTGAERRGNRRGRPLPSRPGRPGNGARIDLVATLRAAAPWQPLRRQGEVPSDALLRVRAGDLRLRRFREMSDRVLIFAVDASGSAAFARLAEAKGAVELLLAEAYARRDHVALIAFRGSEAELMLPPTRSLVQTKRRLAGLPGGGGTPLAAGLGLAMQTAGQARARGLTPTVALLTDGRGNIALSGAADRAAAEADALRLARALKAAAVPGLVIDTGNRPEPSLKALAATMGASYLALPRADAHRLSAALGLALDG